MLKRGLDWKKKRLHNEQIELELFGCVERMGVGKMTKGLLMKEIIRRKGTESKVEVQITGIYG